MEQLKIDPEFRDKIPPLTEAEYEQLKENILTAGEVYEPIVVWNGTIIDGHNRWRVVQENPGISYRVRAMDFPDKWAAFAWMYKNQLGRRNLTEQQRDTLMGQMYKAEKKSVGEHKGNQHTKLELAQNEPIPKKPPTSTAERVARQLGVGSMTVKRAEHFAEGIGAMKAMNGDGKAAAEKILSGAAKVSKETVRTFAKMEPERQKEVVKNVLAGKPADPPKPKPRPVAVPKPKPPDEPPKEKPLSMKAQIAQAVADLKNPDKVSSYGVEDFTQELEYSVTMFTGAFEGSVTRRKGLFAPADAKKAVCGVLDGLKKTIKKWEENL